MATIAAATRSTGISAQLVIAIMASCALAHVLPYDVIFDRLTVGSGFARAVDMFLIWSAGLKLREANGFSLSAVNLRRPVLTIAVAALVVATWCVLLDAFVFRAILPAGYLSIEHQPLIVRLLYFCSRAFNENVLYRLFLGSLFAFGLRRLWPSPRLAFTLSMVGMAIAQLINVAANVAPMGLSVESSVWMLLRFFVPGVFWAYLYVRHGFAANEGAAIGVHWFLQPMATLAV